MSIRLTASSSIGAINQHAINAQMCDQLTALDTRLFRAPTQCTVSSIIVSLTPSLTTIVNIDIELRSMEPEADRDQLLRLLARHGLSIGGFVMAGSAASTTSAAATRSPTAGVPSGGTTADPADAVDPAGSAADDDEGTSVHVGLLALVIVSLVLCIGVIVVIRRRSTAGSVSRQKWEQANRSAGSNVASPDFQFSQLSGGQQYSNSAYAGGAGDIYRTGGQQAAGDAAINADDPSWPDHAPQSSSI